MTSASQRSIDDDLPGLGIQPFQHFARKNRDMDRKPGVHAFQDTPPALAACGGGLVTFCGAIDPQAPPCAYGWVDARESERRLWPARPRGGKPGNLSPERE